MMKRNAGRPRHYHRFIIYIVAVVAVAIVIELLILNLFNKKNSNKTSLVLLNQVVRVIQDNEDNEKELTETLKEDYIIRAQTVAYILDSKPEAEKDVSELRKIADMMRIDEIHLFDKTGKIYSGSEPKYYGYSFDSGDQMAYFKPMLKNKDLTMCQDITPNTAEGKNMMYAITWNEAGDKMIQVGIEPLRLLEELRKNEITEVVDGIPTYEGIEIWVADADSGKIYASSNDDLVGKTLKGIGITDTHYKSGATQKDVIRIDGYKNYCSALKTGDYVVVVAYSLGASIKNFFVAFIIELMYLLLAGVVIFYMLEQVLRANEERNAQMAILVSMSDIYNSMHVINLENDTFKEYNVRNELSKAVDVSMGANDTLKQLMLVATEEKYHKEAIEFTDLHTLAERMKNKKIISKEFVSKVIGWYRASFITIESDLEGHPSRVIYVTQNIDKEKKKEQELYIKSNEDELTGLYNRRAYEDAIAEHDDVVKEEDFVFVSLDVNGLKTVNDTQGHVAGDELLIGAADCMKRCFGPYGRVYRIGGDEFAAMIFAGEMQLQHIKKDFEEVTAKWSGDLVPSLSISSGFVSKQDVDTVSVREMAKIADKKMYEAKAEYYKKNDRRKR